MSQIAGNVAAVLLAASTVTPTYTTLPGREPTVTCATAGASFDLEVQDPKSGAWYVDAAPRNVVAGARIAVEAPGAKVRLVRAGGFVGDLAYVVSGVPVEEHVKASADLAAAGGGTLRFPGGPISFTFTRPDPSVIWEFDGPEVPSSLFGASADRRGKKAMYGVLDGPHVGSNLALQHLYAEPVGCGANGAQNADYTQTLSCYKKDWTTTQEVGEIDGQLIIVRNGGSTTGTKSATGGQVIDVAAMRGVGFICAYEHMSTQYAPTTLEVDYQLDVQECVLNSRDGDYHGFVIQTMVGNVGAVGGSAILIKNQTGSSWGTAIEVEKDGVQTVRVGEDGATTVSNSLTIRSNQATPVLIPIHAIAGAPEAVVSSPVGGIAVRSDGAAGRAAYLKETGSGNTGWNAIVTTALSDNLTAAGSTQADALALASRDHIVTTTPLGTGVRLNNTIRGVQTVFNAGANALLVYPTSGGTIHGSAVDAAVSLAAGTGARFLVASASRFYRL